MLKTIIWSFISSLLLYMHLTASAGSIPNFEGTDAIYGKDDRSFIDKKFNVKMLELSKSIALIVSKDAVQKNFLYSLIKGQVLSDTTGINLCLDEVFSNHHTVYGCTGFLIGEDLLASAGHCFMNQSDCDNKLIAFNVQTRNETKNGYRIFNKNIYECSEIINHVFDDDGIQDYSVIRLKKKASGIKPLKLRRKGQIATSDQVFMIGHPLGLPLVKTTNAIVNDISEAHSFKTTLDSFEGNSGAPVFNSKTFEVEGVLVRGEEDFLQDQAHQCYRYQVYDQGTIDSPSIRGEGVNRISDLLPFLK
ncbi:MAG: serine protease [Bacteriovorax sp.]|nr:serine protease [Bacteriovorax sp.]